MSAIDDLAQLLKDANAVVTFDSERSIAKPCFCCGEKDARRTLEKVGTWSRRVGNRGGAGDAILRPLCAACLKGPP